MSEEWQYQNKPIAACRCFDKDRKRGRQRLVLNELGKEIIEEIARYHLTEEEIAAVLGVSADTLKSIDNRVAFSECIIKGENRGKSDLKCAQFVRAEIGSDQMLTWLGKQYLGQKDRLDVAADAEQLDKLDEILNGMSAIAHGSGGGNENG